MALLDVLFPVACGGCGSPGAPLCSTCAPQLDALRLPPAPGGAADAAFRYEGVARSLVLGLKVRCVRPYARPLGEAMTAALFSLGKRPEMVTWVPARPSAKRHRGFDQAELLAREVARRAGLPCAATLVAAERQDQVGLGRTLRAANAQAAFSAIVDAAIGDGEPRSSVLLVDDLITSGATASACARELSRAGWERVEMLAACRA